MNQCIWCTRPFKPREGGRNIYQLEHAGITICWNCSDSYDAERIRSHTDSLCARMHENGAYTENGSQLPFYFQDWHMSLSPLAQMKARAIDSFGRPWRAAWKDGMITLKPVRISKGVRAMSI